MIGANGTSRAEAATAREDQDAAAVQAIEQRLAAAPGVPAYFITVTANNGVVTLTGAVNDLLARQRAGELAETVPGIRAVRNQIEIRPAERTAREIQESIADTLTAAPTLQDDEIYTSVRDGFVTLSGTVGSWPERHLARLLAEGVPGVRAIDNKLRVAYGLPRTDAEIRADILSRIKWDPWLNTPEIKVDVVNGQVHLDGFVQSASSRGHVYRDSWVGGVRSVDVSGVEIVPNVRVAMNEGGPAHGPASSAKGSLSDAQLQTAIAEACHYDPLLAPANIRVSAAKGVVTLHGTVSSLEAKHIATELAQDFAGVGQVTNLIGVRPARYYSDTEIQNNVERVLRQDSALRSEPIRVSVANGQVYLSGKVDAGFQGSLAAQLAADLPGVTAVEDDLVTPAQNPARRQQMEAASRKLPQWSDSEIKQNIEAQLRSDPMINPGVITVSLSKGVATLTGTVDTRLERRAAVQCANEGGAVIVLDQLKIRSGTGAEAGATVARSG